MNHDKVLTYADHTGRFYVRQFGFPPMAGRLLGYLMVCEPERQTIAELADTLMASRSAIIGALRTLENFHLAKRIRQAGQRMDRVMLDPIGLESNGFDVEVYHAQAAILKEGLSFIGQTPTERRAFLEEAITLADFLAERMPELLREWHKRRELLYELKGGKA